MNMQHMDQNTPEMSEKLLATQIYVSKATKRITNTRNYTTLHNGNGLRFLKEIKKKKNKKPSEQILIISISFCSFRGIFSPILRQSSSLVSRTGREYVTQATWTV